MSGYWPGPVVIGGRRARRASRFPEGAARPRIGQGQTLQVVSRDALAATMVVTRDPGELYLLRHTAGDRATCSVERIDPHSLDAIHQSVDLAGGPPWPGSIAVHANGSLYVVFGNHVHRLDADLTAIATSELPRSRPYNGFVIMPDGHLITKDFAGSRPGVPVAARAAPGVRVGRARAGALGDRRPVHAGRTVHRQAVGSGRRLYVVGDTSLIRVGWDGHLHPDPRVRVPYRTGDGQTYGWDCVIALGAAWFLDNGEGSERYDGTLHGHGVSEAPLRLYAGRSSNRFLVGDRDLRAAGRTHRQSAGVDVDRSITVGYDSGNGAMRAFDIAGDGTLSSRWHRRQDHGGHMLLCPASGELITGHYDAWAGCRPGGGARHRER